jgi:uncharacterized protein YjbI with pentapeptide repeats
VLCWLSLCPAPARAAELPSKDTLERQKLQQEIDQLEQDNGLRGFISGNAAALTALVGVLGLLITLRSQNRESARQRDLDRAQRTADRRQRRADNRQREAETDRRLEERFAAILSDLGSDSQGLQASAVVSLLGFAQPERSAFHSRVRLTSVANLKVAQPEPVRDLLVRVLEEALRTPGPILGLERDLSGAALARADLSKLDLSGAALDATDLRQAKLEDATLQRSEGRETVLEQAFANGAVLTNARLPRARAARARFNGARLVNAHLREADIRGGSFKGAELQGAHLESADLQGARFDGANVADTYFVGAKLDDVALRSLLHAANRDRAHFSRDDHDRLKALDRTGGHNEGHTPDEGPPGGSLPPGGAPG